MKRTIKFRAWNGKAFISTDIYLKQDGSVYSYEKDYGGTFSSNETLEPIECIIQQYTGLKDKNEKEIYEGDIICFENQEGVWLDQVNRNIEVKYPFICGTAHLGEIIGNIFES